MLNNVMLEYKVS